SDLSHRQPAECSPQVLPKFSSLLFQSWFTPFNLLCNRRVGVFHSGNRAGAVLELAVQSIDAGLRPGGTDQTLPRFAFGFGIDPHAAVPVFNQSGNGFAVPVERPAQLRFAKRQTVTFETHGVAGVPDVPGFAVAIHF